MHNKLEYQRFTPSGFKDTEITNKSLAKGEFLYKFFHLKQFKDKTNMCVFVILNTSRYMLQTLFSHHLFQRYVS